MKNIKIVMIAVLGLIFCGAAIFPKEDCRKRAETFLAGLLEGEIDKSYDELLPEWLRDAQQQEVQVLKSRTKLILDSNGELFGYEFIKQQKYGSCMIRLVYVIKAERVPFTLEFYFYKASSDWSFINVKLSDEYDLLADK